MFNFTWRSKSAKCKKSALKDKENAFKDEEDTLNEKEDTLNDKENALKDKENALKDKENALKDKENALTIEVEGRSWITRTAERAILSIQVSTEGKDQESVSNQLMTRVMQLQTLFAELSPRTASGEPTTDAAVTAWSMGGLGTSSDTPCSSDGVELDRKYTATTSFKLEFRDFTRLSSVTTQLLAIPDVSIGYTNWRLWGETRRSLGSRSRKMAVQEALAKAKDLAEAAGYRSVKPIEIVDEYSEEETQSEMPAGRLVGYGGDAALYFVPEEIHVKTKVTVKLRAEM